MRYIFLVIMSLISAALVGVDSKTEEKATILKVGTSLDLSKSDSFLGKDVQHVMSRYVNDINKQEGSKGRRILLTTYDDAYDPKKARKNIQKFLENGVDITLNSVGSPTLNSYLDEIENKKVLVMFPIAGTSFQQGVIGDKSKSRDLSYIIRLRASIYDQGFLLAKYAFTKLNSKKMGVFYQDDVYGLQGLAGVQKYIKETGKESLKICPIKYRRHQTNLKDEADELEKCEVDSIIFISTPSQAKSLLENLDPTFLSTKKLLGVEDLAGAFFQSFLKKLGLSMMLVHVVPPIESSSLQIVKDFKKEGGSWGVPLNSYTFEAYINTKLFLYLLEQIKGPVTKEALVKAAESIRNLDFGGLKLNFNLDKRQLLHTVWISSDNGEVVMESIK